MRIALLQTAGDPSNDPAANLERLDRAAARAAAGDADLLVAPEMFLSGYAIGREAAERLAEPADGPSARRAAEIARAHKLALVYGYPERGADGNIYNAAVLIDNTGWQLLNYRKAHLFAALDRTMFSPGDRLDEVAKLPFAVPVSRGLLRIGLLICYDVEFPEAARALALAGAELIVVPTANMKPYEQVSRLIIPARAFENSVFVAYANRCGSEGSLDYYGMSCIAGPDGSHLAIAGDGEEMIFADLDYGEIGYARALNSYLRDRRPELYDPPVPD